MSGNECRHSFRLIRLQNLTDLASHADPFAGAFSDRGDGVRGMEQGQKATTDWPSEMLQQKIVLEGDNVLAHLLLRRAVTLTKAKLPPSGSSFCEPVEWGA